MKKTETVFPVRIVKTEGNFVKAESLLKEKPLQIGLAERDLTSVKGDG